MEGKVGAGPFKRQPAGEARLMCRHAVVVSHHNYQGCRSYEAPDEVGVQAEPATAGDGGGRWGEWEMS